MIKIKCPKCGCTFDVIEIHVPTIGYYECPNCEHHISILSSHCRTTWMGDADLGDADFIEILINRSRTDELFLHTHMPSTFPSGISNDHLILSTEVQKGKSLKYAVTYFPNKDINVIDCKNGTKHWITEKERKKIMEEK